MSFTVTKTRVVRTLEMLVECRVLVSSLVAEGARPQSLLSSVTRLEEEMASCRDDILRMMIVLSNGLQEKQGGTGNGIGEIFFTWDDTNNVHRCAQTVLSVGERLRRFVCQFISMGKHC